MAAHQLFRPVPQMQVAQAVAADQQLDRLLQFMLRRGQHIDGVGRCQLQPSLDVAERETRFAADQQLHHIAAVPERGAL